MMRSLGASVVSFALFSLFFAILSFSSAQSVRKAEDVKQNARRFEQELKEHGFTNAKVTVGGGDSVGWRTDTRLYGPSVSNISILGQLKLPDPYLRLYQTQVSDLSPLTNIPLKELVLEDAPNVSNLSLVALHGARLEILWLGGTSIDDLTLLAGMPLRVFGLRSSRVDDLSVLAPMQLNTCFLSSNLISDISVLKGKPLCWLTLCEKGVTNISTLKGLPLRYLDLKGSEVRDLGFLKDAPLEQLRFTVEIVTNGLDVIRSMESLKQINEMPSTMFWTQYETTRGQEDLGTDRKRR